MNKIRELRLRKNITQFELANELGLTQGIVSSWENGRNKPTLNTAQKLANVLSCSLDELFGEVDPQENHESEKKESEEGK